MLSLLRSHSTTRGTGIAERDLNLGLEIDERSYSATSVSGGEASEACCRAKGAMMSAMRTDSLAVQMILASLLSAASSAVFLVFLILVVALAGAAEDFGMVAASLVMSLLMGTVVGIGLAVPAALMAGLPTFFVGTFLWDLGRTRRWARHPLAFAVVGLLFGLAVYGLLFGTSGLSRSDVPLLEEHGSITLSIIFSCAGAGAGMVFRISAALLGRSLKLDEADPHAN